MYPDKNMLEQLKNLSVYAKQLKEISSFLQQTPNFYDTVKQYQNFADNIQRNPQQQIQALEQFRSFFRTYEKEIKETFSENQIARFEKEYDEISSNPNEAGKENFCYIFYVRCFDYFGCCSNSLCKFNKKPYRGIYSQVYRRRKYKKLS